LKRRFLLASHGRLADGMHESVKIIIGKQDNISTLCAYISSEKNLSQQVKEVINNLEDGEELIVITDIFGGSVNNEFMKYINYENLHIISSMCLPLVIELITSQEESTEKLIEETIKNTQENIRYCNKTFHTAKSIRDEEF
jgi:Phosphotransferase system, mannose/fructose-specific component IIA